MVPEYSPEVLADLQVMVADSLRVWGLSAQAAISLLNVSENATFSLRDAGDGHELVLRVHRVGYSSAEEICSELAWIDALRGEGVIETLTPVPGLDGEYVQTLRSRSGRPSRHAVAFERLPGKEPDAGLDALRWFERLGEVSAKMHAHSKSWRLPEGFRRKRWDVEAMVGERAYWGPWRAALGLDAAGAVVLEQALSCIGERIARFGVGAARFGLVHADLRLANLLVEDEQLRIIDFDDCGFSWFMYDFAAAVSFMEQEPILPELLRAWVSGYRGVAPLSVEDAAEIPTFVVLRRILLTAWLASHSEVPIARQLGAAYTAGTVLLAQEFLRGQFLSPAAAGSGSDHV